MPNSNKPSFLQQLSSSPILWQMPKPLRIEDPAWKATWENASDFERKNIARGWLWSAMTFDSFIESFDKHHEWVQTLQPYLDKEFFSNHLDIESWAYMALFMGHASIEEVADVLHESSIKAGLLMSKYFFGSQDERRTALLAVPSASEVSFYEMYTAGVRQAWKIADVSQFDWQHPLHLAARRVTELAGENFVLPSPDLPDRAKLYQVVAHYNRRSMLDDEIENLLPQAELKARVQQEEPAFAASLLYESMKYHTFTAGDPPEMYLHRNSFLVDSVDKDEAYPVLMGWIPSRIDQLETAKAFGINAVEACLLIANEHVPASNIDGQALPSEGMDNLQ